MPSLIEELQQSPVSQVFPHPLSSEHCLRIDLSATNPDLSAGTVYDRPSLQKYINTLLGRAQKSYALGGYGEHRGIYRRFDHFGSSPKAAMRDYHLGVDIWTQEGSPVCSPLAGKIHSLADNNNPGDYGGTLILKHQLGQNYLYSLYGHLHPGCLEQWKPGDPVSAGQHLALLGGPDVNVGWPPHLHFQLIRTMGGHKGDFPGVCSKDELAFYLKLCPNPEHLLRPEI